jgi:simple sugar transport system permease protein
MALRLKRRQQPLASPIAGLGIVFASVIAAFVLCAGVIALAGANPLEAYWAIVAGAFGSTNGFGNVVMKATPILLTGLGTTVAFRSGQWNIGGDGQIYMGALGGTIIGLMLGGFPGKLVLPLAVLTAFVAGAAWALIPAILKAYRDVSEIISTLMLTYVATFIIQYLVDGPLQGSSSYMPQTDPIAEVARLPMLLQQYRLHAGTVIALVATALVYVLLWSTPFGYELRAIGQSLEAARYGGISVKRDIIFVLLISGGLSGLAGANEVLGYHYRLYDGISPGYGFTGITVALLGRLNPVGLTISSLLFSALLVGANNMRSAVGVPTAIAGIIQGVVVLFALGTQILLEYQPIISLPFRRHGSH